MNKRVCFALLIASSLALPGCGSLLPDATQVQKALNALSPETKTQIQSALKSFLALSEDEQLEVAEVSESPELVSYLRSQSGKSSATRRKNIESYCQSRPELVSRLERGRQDLDTYYQSNQQEVIGAVEAWMDLDDTDWQSQWQQSQQELGAWKQKLDAMRKQKNFGNAGSQYTNLPQLADEIEVCLALPPAQQRVRMQQIRQRYPGWFNQGRPAAYPARPAPVLNNVYQHVSITIINQGGTCCRPYPGYPPYPNHPGPRPTARPTPTPTPSATPTATPTPSPTAEPTTEPTTEPTATPTPEPTAEPTAEPTPTPEPTPTADPACEVSADNLVANGGFENPVIGAVWDFSPTLPCWVLVEPQKAELDPPTIWQPAVGNQSLDLNPDAPGEIYQTLQTTPGQAYNLSFRLAGNIQGNFGIKQVKVFWGEHVLGTFSFDTTGKSAENMGWISQQVTIPAALTSSSEVKLRFKSLTEGSIGPVLDQVIVSPQS